MAKATAKNKRGKSLEPVIALYGLDTGSERGDAVRDAISSVGLRTKTIRTEGLGDPVGSVAGLTGFRPARTPYPGPAPQIEFMLFCNCSSAQVDQVLAALREHNASVSLKAQVTQYNRLWPLHKLMQEISKEHAAMTSGDTDDSE